uniref:Putative ovule protein n=1 Tax=Solanum chacoense TaxID=4108 RepID=A0A0V0GL85_SOLCH
MLSEPNCCPLPAPPPREHDPSLSSQTKDTKAEETNQGSNIHNEELPAQINKTIQVGRQATN